MPGSPMADEDQVSTDNDVDIVEDANADPSTAEGEVEPDLMSVIDDVLGEGETEEVTPASQTGSEVKEDQAGSEPEADAEKENKAEGEGEEKADEVKPEELEGLPEKTRDRINTLLTDRANERKRADEYQDKAQRFDSLASQVQEKGLQSAEVDKLIDMGGMLVEARTSPAAAAKALETLDQYRNQLMTITGQRVAPELNQQVREGHISPELAQQLAASQQTERALQAQIEQQRAAAERQQATDHNLAVQNAVSAREAQWKSSDPDYASKQPMVQEIVLAKAAEAAAQGRQLQPQEAVAAMDAAKKQVEAWLRTVRPANTTPIAGKPELPGAAQAQSEPRDLMDVVERALGA